MGGGHPILTIVTSIIVSVMIVSDIALCTIHNPQPNPPAPKPKKTPPEETWEEVRRRLSAVGPIGSCVNCESDG